MKTYKKQLISHNASLINAIAPSAIKYSKDGFSFGNSECSGLSVIRFPATVDYEWLNEVCNLRNTMTAITYTPENDMSDILKSLGNIVSQKRPTADGKVSSDPVEQVRAQKTVADGQRLIDRLANGNDSIGYSTLDTVVVGNSKDDCKLKEKSVRNKFAGRGFSVASATFLQKELLQSISPCDRLPQRIQEMASQLMPLRTMLGGFPFSFAGYNDGIGSYWGKDSSGGMVIIDPWKRGGDRTNSNIVAMGVSGVGKSTALKHLILNEWELGTKIIVIDPHGEYKKMCQRLNGDWINLVGGSNGRINPLHIYKHAEDESEEENAKLSDLARHIKHLEVFFSLYLDLSTLHIAVIEECLEIVYKAKNITWETDITKLTPEQYPIMSDLYNVICTRSKEVLASLRTGEKNLYKELAILLRSIAIGADSFLWNGFSTVNPTSDFVVFDTSSVNNNTDRIRTTMYHVALNYCEDYLFRNPHERVILVADEAHNMISNRLPATAARLANIEKSVRKFESALWICSQELIDFLDDSIRKEGETLLNQPNIKLLMPVGRGRELKELKDLYNLTDAEEELLLQEQRGRGLLSVGSRRFAIDFDLPLFRFDDMGGGGGR